MRPPEGLQDGRIYQLPEGLRVVVQPAMDETMRFPREGERWDLYTQDQWREAGFAGLTVRTDGRIASLQVEDGTIEGPGQLLNITLDDLEPTSEVVGCEFCAGLPWPGDLTLDSGHGAHEATCPLLGS
jgi:hypothetical protein